MSRQGARSRYRFNRDANERPIIETLEARGFAVTQINGKGVPDLLVSKHGACWLVEVKMPKGKYNANQIQWRGRWQGPPPITIRTVDEAILFPNPQPPTAHGSTA